MKRFALLVLAAAMVSGCSSLTNQTRYTGSGEKVVIGQFPPESSFQCNMVHNEVLEQSLLQRYTDEGSILGFYADSEKTLSIAENKKANYVHIYLPPKKMLFGVVDLNYNDKPRATYYQCKQLPGNG